MKDRDRFRKLYLTGEGHDNLTDKYLNRSYIDFGKKYGYDFSDTNVSTQGETIGQLTKDQTETLNKAIVQITNFHQTVDQVTKNLNITNEDIKKAIQDYVKNERINDSYKDASDNRNIF